MENSCDKSCTQKYYCRMLPRGLQNAIEGQSKDIASTTCGTALEDWYVSASRPSLATNMG